MKRSLLVDRLFAGTTYRVAELQELLGIPAQELIDAALTGDIARFLGEGVGQMVLLGSDVQMWLMDEEPWPSDAGTEAADTVGCRMARINVPISDRQQSRQKALREQVEIDSDTIDQRNNFAQRDPRDLVLVGVRIPRNTREQIQQRALRLNLSESEIHRRALERGLSLTPIDADDAAADDWPHENAAAGPEGTEAA